MKLFNMQIKFLALFVNGSFLILATRMVEGCRYSI